MTATFGRAQHPQSGVYWWGDKPFTAVTSVLGAISKPALAPAAAKEVSLYVNENWDILAQLEPSARHNLMKGAASRKWGQAAQTGSEVHHAVSTLLEEDGGFPGHLLMFEKAWFEFLQTHEIAVEYNEVTVYNRKCGYAGTLDIIADVDGVCTLIDIKTGGVWPDAALQVNAYANAEFIGLNGKEVEMPKVEQLAILQLTSEGTHNLIPVCYDADVFRYFRHVIEVYRWTKKPQTDIFTKE